jgi:hypothetical protein
VWGGGEGGDLQMWGSGATGCLGSKMFRVCVVSIPGWPVGTAQLCQAATAGLAHPVSQQLISVGFGAHHPLCVMMLPDRSFAYPIARSPARLPAH